MKKKRIVLILAALPVLTVIVLIGGFKLQQVIAPFRGIATEQDGAYVEYRYYLALRPSHMRIKWGSGRFSRVQHGPAVAYWPDGALRGQWNYVDGHRDGHVTTWHQDGRLRATWEAKAGQAAEGTLVVYTDEAEKEFIQQGSAPLRQNAPHSGEGES